MTRLAAVTTAHDTASASLAITVDRRNPSLPAFRRARSRVCAMLLLAWGCTADTPPAPPEHWRSATPLDLIAGISRVKVSHNSPEAIRRELLDPITLRLLAKSSGLSDKDLRSVKVAQEPGAGWVQLYQTGGSDKKFQTLSQRLRDYVRAREDGHTRGFLLAAITNAAPSSSVSDPDLKALLGSQPLLPASWLKKADSGTITNKAGQEASRTITTTTINGKEVTSETVHIPKVDEVCRWVSYTVADGEIGWWYLIKFKADGSVDDVQESRCDAKEYDPRYQKAIKQVEREVKAAMKKDGSYGQFGSCHTFWHLKKEKLKARGIDWRSPTELNPNTCFD